MFKSLFRKAGLLVLVCLALFLNSSVLAEDYVISRGDRLNISVWGNKNLNSNVTVRSDGMITFPLIGEVKAEGLKPLQLRKIITHKLSTFVKNPEITVMVLGMNDFRIYVFGNLPAAGVHQINGGTTYLQFFSIIGQIPEHVDLEESFLIRNNKRYPFDLASLLKKGDLSQNIIIKPGDTLFFKDRVSAVDALKKTDTGAPQDTKVRVLGEVKRPGIIAYSEGMTLLDAILAAGSFSDYADSSETKIIRRNEDKIQEIVIDVGDVMSGAIDKNILIEPGDLIYVPESFF